MIHQFPLDQPALVGGIETWISDFLRNARGSYRLLGVRTASTSAELVDDLGAAEVFCTGTLPGSNALGRLLPNTLWLAWFTMRARKLLSDKVLVHRMELVPLIKLIRPRSRVYLVIHFNAEAQFSANHESRWRRWPVLYYLLESVSLRLAHSVLVYSKREIPRIRKANNRTILGKAWFNDEYFFQPPRESPRQKQVIWVGRFEAVKDPLVAVKAFSESALSQEYRLILVGQGSLEPTLRSTIDSLKLTGRVQLLSPLKPLELGDLFRSASALLMTSHSEGAPRVLVEALACGLPVVAFRDCDPEGWVRRGENGRLAGRNLESLVSALEETCAQPPRIDRDAVSAQRASEYVRTIEEKFIGRPRS